MTNPTLKSFLEGKHTLEEVVQYIDQQLEQQGKAATITVAQGSYCAFRTPDGCKCAIGHLIPDDEFNANQTLRKDDIASMGIYSYANVFHPEYVEDEKLYMLYILQRAHDRAAYADNFIETYRNISQQELNTIKEN